MQDLLRSAIAWVLAISALGGPLIFAYNFFSSHGYLWGPHANFGMLTIVVNVCFVAGLIGLESVLSAAFPLWCVVEAGKGGIYRVLNPVALLGLGVALVVTSPSSYARNGVPLPVGRMAAFVVLCLAAVSCFHAGIKFVVNRFLPLLVVLSIMSLSIFLLAARKTTFAIVALQSMDIFGWIMAGIGALLYVVCFIAFKQWYTKGKWLQKTNKPGD